MEDKVKVEFSVTLCGSYSREVEIPKDEYEYMRDENPKMLGEFLSDYIRWGDVTVEVDDVDLFEALQAGEEK